MPIHDSPEFDLHAVWHSQHTETKPMKRADYEKRLRAFGTGQALRKAFGAMASVCAIAVFGAALVKTGDMGLQVGLGLLALWVIAVTLLLPRVCGVVAGEACLAYLRDALRTERHFLGQSVTLGATTALPILGLIAWRGLALLPLSLHTAGLIVVGICGFVWLKKVFVFRWQMRRLDVEIAALSDY